MNPAENIGGESLAWPEIVSQAVHDMRTPLSSMRTTLEILRMISGDPDKQAKLVGVLDKQVDELSAYLETLLDDPESFVRANR